jgi:hypothetical protein
MGIFSSKPVLTDVYNANAAEGDTPWVVVGNLPENHILKSFCDNQSRYEFCDSEDEDEEDEE